MDKSNNCFHSDISQFSRTMKTRRFLFWIACQLLSLRIVLDFWTYLRSIGMICWISSEWWWVETTSVYPVDFIVISSSRDKLGNILVVEENCSSCWGDSSLLQVVDDKQRVSLRSTCMIHLWIKRKSSFLSYKRRRKKKKKNLEKRKYNES